MPATQTTRVVGGFRSYLPVFLCFLVILIRCINAENLVDSELTIKSADKHIDLQSQLTKITSRLVLENGSKDRQIKYFLFAIDPKSAERLSYIAAYREPGRVELRVGPAEKIDQIEVHRIELKDPLAAGRSASIEVETVFAHELVPHPKQIAQKEKQLVKYTGNVYLYSPYTVNRQTTTISLPSRNIESYTKTIKPVSQSDSSLTYGPFEKRPPYSRDEFSVHFENNNRFLTVTRLERTIEISHWGNIAVEERIELLHTGALLKGSFSRYEYARESKSGQASVQSFDTILPAAAADIYYRDEIGNISTSHTRIKKDSVELNLRPRFPLFGGWKTKYTIGYNLPSYEYLFHSGDDYLLEMRLLDHVFDDMLVDELLLKIILPEGSRDIRLSLPYAATRLPDSLRYTYLDTTGRPVISIAKENLVENHIQSFKLNYRFPRLLMLQEPLLVAAALYLFFLLVIVYVRLDFSIDKDEMSESKLRIAGHCEKILAAQDRRIVAFNNLEDQLSYLKANKDTNVFFAAVKTINQEYKAATAVISPIAYQLRADGGDLYERIKELQKYDRILKELYNQQQALYVDKLLVPGKIGRQQFVEAESAISKKKEECVEKINSILKSLQ